jgi:adsorption protein B
MWAELLVWFWLVLRVIFSVLVVLFLISGLDDLFVDLVYYVRWLWRKLFRRKLVRPLTLERLSSVDEQLVAVMVPAWDESSVIRRMLLNTTGTLQYRNYHIFVGVYANDDATRLEVESVALNHPRVHVVVNPHDGPTNKADCLNWVFQGIKAFEATHDGEFDIFVMQDAEDIIHPVSLKYYNYLIPRFHFIQLPVFPLATRLGDFVTGTYMDEFAESHTKELRVRELMTTALPSAGVGTAISREAMDFMAQRSHNQLFDVTSLTEDYMFGLRLSRFGGKKMFLQQAVSAGGVGALREQRGHMEPLATRALFPTTFQDAVRQKGRWILGITLQGWRAGWGESVGDAYYMYRDRKGIITNLAVFLGYAVMLLAGMLWVAHRLLGWEALPPLVSPESGLLYLAFRIVMWILLWRLLNRVGASWNVYGAAHGLMAIPRLVFGNVLNFVATCSAISRFVRAKFTGEQPAWQKTAHAFPSDAQLQKYHRRLGDLLLEHKMVTVEQLTEALDQQRATGRRLGELLLDSGALWDEDLIFALAEQDHRHAVEIDPYGVAPELLARVPQALAREQRVFPVATDGVALVLATDRRDQAEVRRDMMGHLRCEVLIRACATVDLEYALSHAYQTDHKVPRSPDERLGERLVRVGLITPEQLRDAIRSQKRAYSPLGEILITSRVVQRDQLEEALRQ